MHLSLMFAVLLAPCANGIDVHVKDSLVDVAAKMAPVSAVLECLGGKLDIEIVDQEKVLPTRVISVALRRQSSREAVEQILVQAGMNYALQLEKKSGGAIKRIVVTGTKPIPPGAPVMPASELPASAAEPTAAPPTVNDQTPTPAPSGAGGPRERRRERQERLRGGGAGRPLPPGPDAAPTAAPLYPEPRSLTPTS